MSEPLTIPPPGFDELSVEEKIDYVQRLWRRIASQPNDLPSADWQMKLLEKRLDEIESTGDRGRPWDQVRADLHERLRTLRK